MNRKELFPEIPDLSEKLKILKNFFIANNLFLTRLSLSRKTIDDFRKFCLLINSFSDRTSSFLLIIFITIFL